MKELVQVTQGTQAEMRKRWDKEEEKQKEGEKAPPGGGQQQS